MLGYGRYMDCVSENEIVCKLDEINRTLAAPDLVVDITLPILGVLISAILGFAAFTAARSANRLAAMNTELAQRSERRRFGDAMLSYFDSRIEDIRTGNNADLPHWSETVEEIAHEIGEPNATALLNWLKQTIDHSFTGPTDDREINALWIQAKVPAIIGRWVNDPANFQEPKHELRHEKHAHKVHTVSNATQA